MPTVTEIHPQCSDFRESNTDIKTYKEATVPADDTPQRGYTETSIKLLCLIKIYSEEPQIAYAQIHQTEDFFFLNMSSMKMHFIVWTTRSKTEGHSE